MRLPKEFAERLFGVTKLGMTVVIADDKSQPVEVTHPGMVLGEYAAREFHAVDTAVMATEYSEGHERTPKSPSVVVCSADRSIRVFDNGALAASGKVEIQDPAKPLGERVLHAERRGRSVGGPHLASANVGGTAKTTNQDSGAALRRRIKAEPGARGGPQAAEIRHDHRHHRPAGRRQDPLRRRVRRAGFHRAEAGEDCSTELSLPRGGQSRPSHQPNWSRIFRDRSVGREKGESFDRRLMRPACGRTGPCEIRR